MGGMHVNRHILALSLVAVGCATGGDDPTVIDARQQRPTDAPRVVDASRPIDAHYDARRQQIKDGVMCDIEICIDTDVCCLIATPFGNVESCLPTEIPCAGRPYLCDGSEDCSGTPCCESGTGAACQASPCTDPTMTLCNDDDDCPGSYVCCPAAPEERRNCAINSASCAS